jgi:hypothetical protein
VVKMVPPPSLLRWITHDRPRQGRAPVKGNHPAISQLPASISQKLIWSGGVRWRKPPGWSKWSPLPTCYAGTQLPRPVVRIGRGHFFRLTSAFSGTPQLIGAGPPILIIGCNTFLSDKRMLSE